MLNHIYPFARETILLRCTVGYMRIPYEALNSQKSCRTNGDVMSAVVFPFYFSMVFPTSLGQVGLQDCENHAVDGLLCAAQDHKGPGPTSHPQKQAVARAKAGKSGSSSPPCQPGGRLVASSSPLSSLNNITFSRSLFPPPHLPAILPNLPFKAYLHAHVILTTVQWPGLFFFLEFVSCRTNLCDLELPLVSANLELLPR